jgi:hypothetical protein
VADGPLKYFVESFVQSPILADRLSSLPRRIFRDDHDRCEAGVRRSGSRPDTQCGEEHQNNGADGEDAV